MYRQSMLGTALGCALSELTERHGLTEDQKDHIWRVFDETMAESLREAPILSRVFVQQPPPCVRQSRKRARAQAPTIHATLEEEDAPAPPGSRAASAAKRACLEGGSTAGVAAGADRPLSEVVDEIAFPAYRCIRGQWTILLKDPVVSVRDEYGEEENIQLDFLKVHLEDKFYTSRD
ncbi:hypothetical protein STCU_02972 [Strigomonas culicis]|uniref:Uncharacterized protein n=1 Tax=Strigomonas culicis TaxID=28005 RepID=S9UTB1_9TRYP|nr:hypothetical protein STCU_02972 [Strigomonas culicis]|eukprot:EPY32108.1 hypothetical protein STCU_02972 [Strigomonas culicis]